MYDYRQLQTARLNLGLTQEQLARKLNVSTSALQKWEQGQRKPKPNTTKKLQKILNLQLEP